jgi:Protein of unknown function (DUF3995)
MKNVHERKVPFSIDEVAPLLDSLSSPSDRLWPRDVWPPMKLDHGLAVGSKGGHGMIRYSVDAYEPGRSVTFRFAEGLGLDGTHSFRLADDGKGGTLLKHEIDARVEGSMRLMWPLVVRWMHDTVVEDAFDTAEASLNGRPTPQRHPSRYVSFLKRSMVPARADARGEQSGVCAAIVLGAIGLLHAAWGAGLTFPAADATSLAKAVVGGSTFPSPVDCFVVAALLAAATTLVLSRAKPQSTVGKAIPPLVSRFGSSAVAGVLAARGLGGLVVGALGVPRTTSTFRVLDLVLYSPLCLALAAAVLRIEKPLRHRSKPIAQKANQVVERVARP